MRGTVHTVKQTGNDVRVLVVKHTKIATPNECACQHTHSMCVCE